MERLGLDEHGLTAHHLARHTAATIWAKGGASGPQLMAAGGWDTLEMVERYMEVDEEMAAEAVSKDGH